jgi:hypothetical protein
MVSFVQRKMTTFAQGLVTEANELTFPENASVDELNCLLEKSGLRRRRPGFGFEQGHEFSSFTLSNPTMFNLGSWVNVGGNSAKEYACLQVENKVYFYNKTASPISGQQLGDSVDLSLYAVLGGCGCSERVSFTSIKGALVIAGPGIDTLLVEEESGSISVSPIAFKVRDFEWQGDTQGYAAASASGVTTDQRKYDTANAGWTTPKGVAALNTYTTARTAYPPLTHPWFAGKNSDGDFSLDNWEKVYSGSSLVGNGHFVYDLFNFDRASKVGSTDTALNYVETSRFKTVCAFSGRVFFAGLGGKKFANKVFFSKLVEGFPDLGVLYQQNDPTSEDFSDLLDTDGGVIDIPEAYNINLLATFADSILVFAENGVWRVKGVDGVFKATEFSVVKLTPIGLAYPSSYVDVGGAPIWWSNEGIHTFQVKEGDITPSEVSLTQATIQTYYDEIPRNVRRGVSAVYDREGKKVYWGYSSDLNRPYVADSFLVFDISLGAFTPWKVSLKPTESPFIVGGFYYSGLGSQSTVEDVLVGDNPALVVDDQVQVTLGAPTFGKSDVKFFVFNPENSRVTVGTFFLDTFKDWNTENYESYAESGYDFLGDISVTKGAPLLAVALRYTEPTEDMARESSVFVSSFWDFRSTAATKQQGYLPRPVNGHTLQDYQSGVVITRLKVRGRGKVMNLRFESQEGKDFQLLGWELVGARNQRF